MNSADAGGINRSESFVQIRDLLFLLYLRFMKKIFLLLCLLSTGFAVTAQTTDPPFRKEIDAFKKKDSLQMPAKQSILFVGSSSFTKWTDVQDYFPGYPILNRGFGGSSLPDVIRYVDEVIIPYDPKQIVIYCGENDVAGSDTITAPTVLKRFQTIFSLIRNKLPKVPIAFISLKPSVSRWKFEPVIVETNKLIKDFLSKQSNAKFINVHDAMLNTDGSVMTDIFIADNLHMNAKGYKIWQPIIQ
ncbi:MAG: family lipolytic protein [Sediminibacterium sp.]|nr:family lipolytic protein [Sediminibacterium sp.]